MGKKQISNEELKQRWGERCVSGNFSSAVLGKGTVSVMGTSGDEAFVFPRIASLAVLDQPDALGEDEVWAVRHAEEIIRVARNRNGKHHAVIGRNNSNEAATLQPTFDPSLEQITVLVPLAGG